ncbi:carcinoembryonic antigen-related cell adhesion molecule 3-like isoform X1 [Cricetulus griseus]|uniref:carcinoembryonic antigen-related cell adhesion molecule 3-like isoform X1 n=1 Tax=Cricetulus griseus TaxID=10029 RepID=UPI000F74541A|nr:carcinoembryonic antigen-related cell adhesion molecule 3-like isoform X1 [Cricetulus griseus]
MAFLWNCEFLATSPKLTIESVPPIVAEGRSVLLLVHNPPENIAGFVWFKGTTTIDNFVVSQYTLYKKLTVWGPAYGGRETLYSDGSLLLHSVTVKDSGLYILRILWTDMRSQDAQVQLQVDTSLSPFCNLLNSSQFTIQPVPRYAAEGEDVLFQVHSLPEDLQSFSWYKLEDKNLFHKIVEYSRAMDSISWEPTHRGRGMVYKNGSLMLQGITEKDAGMYTLSILNKYFKVERAYVEVYVKKNVTQPFVRISDTMVAGHRSVTFTCISPDTDISIRWIFNKQNLEITERMTLSPTKCGLRINPVRIEDTGDYQSSLLSLWHLPTTEQFPSDSVPALVAEGDNVLLPVRSLPAKIKSITWYKEIRNETKEIAVYTLRNNLNKPGPAHRGRETIYRNGSLLIEKVNTKDTGFYTLRTRNRHGKIVSTSVKYLDVIQLTTSYIWFKGKIDLKNLVGIQNVRDRKPTLWGPAYRGRQIMNNDGSLLIQRVTRKDSGFYTPRFLRADAKTDDVQVQLHVDSYLLSFWHLPTVAQVATELTPPLVAEGDNVLVLVHNLPENLLALAWFKGLTDKKKGIAIYGFHKNLSATGPGHSDRETIYRNGSLLFEKLTKKDTGFYTLRTYNRLGKIVSTTSIYLHVHAFLWNCGRFTTSAQPTIELEPPSVAEGGSVLLRIHNLPENLQSFVWFRGISVFWEHEIARYIIDSKSRITGPAHSGREMLNSDGSLVLHNVTRNDTGLYTLRIQGTDKKSEETHVQLRVDSPLSPCCNPLASSQVMIQPVPLYVAQGGTVLLQVHNLPEDFQAFTWYRAVYRVPYYEIVEYSRILNTLTWGDQYSARETVFFNGSLLLRDITEQDAGMYTLEILKKHVAQPFVRITNSVVSSHRCVIFTCVSPDTDVSIRWFFNNKNLQLSRRMTLSPTKCGLRICPVRMENFGEYKCEVFNRVSVKTSLPVTFH